MATEVGIAELKSRLSQYLRAVRKGGEIIVKDRDTPIARLVPYKTPRKRLTVIPATKPWTTMDQLPFFRPKGMTDEDIDEGIRWLRKERLDDLP